MKRIVLLAESKCILQFFNGFGNSLDQVLAHQNNDQMTNTENKEYM